jgi:beta propeller repeat protein
MKKLFIVSSIILLLVPFAAATYHGFRLTSDGPNLFPRISGNDVIWAKRIQPNNHGIYHFNIATGQRTLIAEDFEKYPSFDVDAENGRYVIVWQTEDPKGKAFHLWDANSPGIVNILVDTEQALTPRISLPWVVWWDFGGKDPKRFVYNIDTQAQRSLGRAGRVVNVALPQYYPHNIHSDGNNFNVVWLDYRENPTNLNPAPQHIYRYSSDSAAESKVSRILGGKNHPAIYGDRIVWHELRNGNVDIYMHEISTGVEKRITTNPAQQRNPVIFGDLIVWEDFRNGLTNRDIYMLDVQTSLEQQVENAAKNQVSPQISGELDENGKVLNYYIVWNDYRHGLPEVYMKIVGVRASEIGLLDVTLATYLKWVKNEQSLLEVLDIN